jgi:processive 1,2-diacylglycerol beta-glucosyltransferase
VELLDFNRAWIQPEVDLYLTTHEDLARELAAAGAPAAKVLTCGQPIDPAFACLPERDAARMRLGLEREGAVLLVLFRGAGFGNPSRVLREIDRLQRCLQVVVITGENARLEGRARKLCQGKTRFRVYGWVDNIQEWMAAADLLVSKPGGTTLAEAFAACRCWLSTPCRATSAEPASGSKNGERATG